MSSRRPLVLVDYDPAWPGRYERERDTILLALGGNVREIHHIGSTSVPGLLSKPVIDVLIGLERLKPTAEEVRAMAAAGFRYLGDYGIPDRCFFAKDDCHAHGFLVGEGQWRAHLRFRDHLRSSRDARERYAAAKLEIAERVDWDRGRYVEEKEHVVAAILREAPIP
jgi:GrpB-like predicted nucleotidyltransferase (UPF0157 family)